jgi:squalene synthase HpnC
MEASLHKIGNSLLQQGPDNRPQLPPTDDPLFLALAQVIQDYRLPLQPFHDLLTAFRMDVEKKRFGDFDELMHYCQFSANPIGLLLLHLYQQATPDNIEYSNAICSALQLINFFQDLAQDYHENQRIYLPLDEMQHYGVDEQHLRDQISDTAMQQLMLLQVERAQQLLHSGAPLGNRLKGRAGLEMRMIIQGGMRILHHLQNCQDNLFARPRLHRRDWLWIMWHAIINRPR